MIARRFQQVAALGALLLAAASNANAQRIPRAELGGVVLIARDLNFNSEAAVFKRGDAVWRERVKPAYAARLLDDMPARPTPKAAAVPAGTLLFGYQLSSGIAYCVPMPFRMTNARGQCLRDVDDNGTFDAAYVGETRGQDSRFLVAIVSGLSGYPSRRYEPAEWPDAEDADSQMLYDGVRGGKHTFRLKIEDHILNWRLPCEPLSGDLCVLSGVTLKITPAADGAIATLMEAPEAREVLVFTTGEISVPRLFDGRSPSGAPRNRDPAP